MTNQLTNKQKVALDHARYLAEYGAPLFVAPADDSTLGFRLPREWQHTEADPSVVDTWQPGMALCLVTGVLVDVVDVDPRNGGDRSAIEELLPKTYGQQRTPSGGTHDLIACLGVPKGKPFPGVDVQAGDPEGHGRGFVFLAPTERQSKVTGEVVAYRWAHAPDVELLALVGDDDTGAALADAMWDSGPAVYDGPNYDGPAYADLSPGQQAEADRIVAENVEMWRSRYAEAEDWPEGQTDDVGRGWEALARDGAWAFARMAATPWMGLDEDAAREAYAEALPAAIANDPQCQDKWDNTIVAKAGSQHIEPPGWDDFSPVLAEGDDRATINVANESSALKWLKTQIGRGPLAGVFRRGEELVHTPRIGEDGYVPPRNDRDHDGPAQVRRLDALELASRIDHNYDVVKQTARSTREAVFPQAIAARAASAPDLLASIRDLAGVTHTPVVRADGTILDAPGYDAASRMLYLPDPVLLVPQVADEPSRRDVETAGQMLLAMVADFPFITVHDRANYLGALLTPLLRPLVPPPYKLVAIGAPQRGSGKTLLAWTLRELHGGVFKSEFPGNDEELRKFVTSTLDATTGPVVQFDNVTGVLKSSVLDGLLTSPEWSDRRLGVNEMLALPNDRLWVVTGNNVHIGGDLERRTLWVTINAGMERPEERSDFAIPDLEGWVRDNRGDLLWALLTLIRSWVTAGSPEPPRPTSDSFGRWIAVLRGILGHANLGETVGVVGHADSIQSAADPEDEEWATFLAAVYRVVEAKPWTASELLTAVWDEDQDFHLGRHEEHDPKGISTAELPGDIGQKWHGSRVAAAKSLGKWLSFRDGRWANGLSAQSFGDRRGSKVWRVVGTDSLL